MPKYIPAREDIMTVVGLAWLWHGLYLLKPWLSFVVVGGIVTVLGLAINRGKAILARHSEK